MTEQPTAVQLAEAQDERARVGATLANLRQQLDAARAAAQRLLNQEQENCGSGREGHLNEDDLVPILEALGTRYLDEGTAPVPGSSRRAPETTAAVDVEELSAAVHEGWMESKRRFGITSRKSESGEELMVPYSQLSEMAKELDRDTVRSVLVGVERVGYVVTRRSAGESQASEPAPAAPKLATGGIVERPIDLDDRARRG